MMTSLVNHSPVLFSSFLTKWELPVVRTFESLSVIIISQIGPIFL